MRVARFYCQWILTIYSNTYKMHKHTCACGLTESSLLDYVFKNKDK